MFFSLAFLTNSASSRVPYPFLRSDGRMTYPICPLALADCYSSDVSAYHILWACRYRITNIIRVPCLFLHLKDQIYNDGQLIP